MQRIYIILLSFYRSFIYKLVLISKTPKVTAIEIKEVSEAEKLRLEEIFYKCSKYSSEFIWTKVGSLKVKKYKTESEFFNFLENYFYCYFTV